MLCASASEPLLGESNSEHQPVTFNGTALAPKVLTIDFKFKNLGLRLNSGAAVLSGVTGGIRSVVFVL